MLTRPSTCWPTQKSRTLIILYRTLASPRGARYAGWREDDRPSLGGETVIRAVDLHRAFFVTGSSTFADGGFSCM